MLRFLAVDQPGLSFSTLPPEFPSYDVINDVIMSDTDCTPGREPRSVSASSNRKLAATLQWFTAGCAIRIALRQLLQNRK